MRLAAAVFLSVLLVVAGLTLRQVPWSYAAQDRTQIAAAASPGHPAGTDDLGRDRAVRTAAALLLGVAGSLCASALASVCSVALGAAAAFASGWVGRLVLYLGDLFLTLPWIFLLMMVRSALPLTVAPLHSAAITFLLLGILGIPAFLRVHYTRVASLRGAEWLLHARAGGLRRRQLLRQFLPHLQPLVLTQFVLYVPACIIAEANLGTLGLGISEPLSSWGSMLQSMQNDIFLNNSRLLYLPIALLVLVLMCLELLAFRAEETST